jgi:cytosine/creatinine deaminase
MKALITKDTPVTEEVLNAIAHLPTRSLTKIVEDDFFRKLTDRDFMRIGGVIISNDTRQILGKGHNTLVQENHPYNHGETSAARDAGRQDFSKTTMFTTLSPCDICASLIYMRQFQRLVVGDVTNFAGNEEMLRKKGVHVDVLEDPEGVTLFAKYFKEKPEQHLEDARGLAEVSKAGVKS